MNIADPCEFCSGAGHQFGDDGAGWECLACRGSGYVTAQGDAGATHSAKRRPYWFTPATGQLGIGLGRRAALYAVSEFVPSDGFGGRAFLLAKLDGSDRYTCRLRAADGPFCDCGGRTFEATVKANFYASLRHEQQYATLGCKHLDVMSALLAGGWLDLPEHVPQFDHPSED